ncbi:olfactory receptor 2T8-like [Dasypus novemcinctus]|uniref:olfactory receptor 2T8-like n=1 Tax=Dasypus novemcinctus TaxID=9361 RepID=UPI00265E66FB|nr:olfactory receptor 2T8-like [Dasypus novemcinctus]
MQNRSYNSHFILLGLLNDTGANVFLFAMMLTIVFISLLVNILLIFLIQQNHQLHTPMYFLLSQLSLMDMMLVCTIVPQMAAGYLTGKKFISPTGCGLQISFLLTLGVGECFLLAAMTYDCFVAVCHPLWYPILMSWQICLTMTLVSWILGAADGFLQVVATQSFPFCKTCKIDHFFCEVPMLLHLVCGDTSVFEYAMYICCVLMTLVPFSFILTSYNLILAAFLHTKSTEACKKAFTTCSSHLTVVGLFYGAAIFIYMRPKSYRSANNDKIVSAFYTVLTPALKPLIYSLRNNALKGTLKKCRGYFGAFNHNRLV